VRCVSQPQHDGRAFIHGRSVSTLFRKSSISAWASITDDFAIGREVEALSTANLKSGHGKKPKDSGSKHTYVYEVVSREDTAGVVHVRMEYRSVTK